MPSYDYRCTACGHAFEARHGIAAARPDCPACGGAVRQEITTAPAVHGHMSRGREAAVRSLHPDAVAGSTAHGPGCSCCKPGR